MPCLLGALAQVVQKQIVKKRYANGLTVEGYMKHKRMSNRRIKQMLEDINHDGLFDDALTNNDSLVDKKDQGTHEVPPNINLDSEDK